MKIRKTLSVCAYFYKLAWKQKPVYFILIILQSIQISAAPFINILFPKYLIDELLGKKRVDYIIIYVLCIVVGNLIVAVLNHILLESRGKYEDWFSRYFTVQISRKAMSMSFEHTESPEAMNLNQKANTGMSWYSGGIAGLSECVIAIASSVITFICIVSIIVTVSPLLILVTMISVIITTVITSKLNKIQIDYFDKLPAINKFYFYIYYKVAYKRYAKDARLYDGKNMILDKALDNANSLYGMQTQVAKDSVKLNLIDIIVGVIIYVFAYAYLCVLAIMKMITIGELTMTISAVETFTKSCMNSLIYNLQEIYKKANFMQAYIEFMEYEDTLTKGNRSILDSNGFTIEFRNVSFKYPRMDEYTLKDVNITIQPGEHLSVVGLNGSGKTTFIKLLCRLYDVTEGCILLNGVDIREYIYEDYLSILAVVFQDVKLFSLSIKENVMLGRQEDEIDDIESAYHMSGISDLLNRLNKYDETLLYREYDEAGIEPSGGEIQKISIARALYKNAPIVILDEPTAALDPVAEYEVYKKFDSLVGGKTAVYISHRMSSCKFCDKIAVFSDKTIKEYGTHDELIKFKNGIYAKMYVAQAKYYV